VAPLNLYDQQKRNRQRTTFFLAGFILFLAVLGLGADAFLYGAGGSPGLPICMLGALAFGGLSAWWSLHGGDQAVLDSTTARPLNPADPREKALDNIVEEMAIAGGVPKPRVYIIPDADPNAFATGPGPEKASIAVTLGTLNALNREELQGVVAHEMSHVRNYDIRLMTVVAALAGSILLLSDWASGAELTRNPLALADALAKIEAAAEPTRSIKQGVAHLCIADPRGRAVNEQGGAWASLFATHPPIAERIALLRGMGYRSDS